MTDSKGPLDEPRSRRRGQGELEAHVLSVLQSAPGPVTAAWVHERLDDTTLAYTTVVTILTRLLAKNAVTRKRAGRSFEWQATSNQAGLAARRMHRVLDADEDRAAVLASFVTSLSPDDEQLLRDLLNQTAENSEG
ncbi:BlaI/MecI/CopY family transcriptional regulator [Streptomyces triculaminicus]|uniref:BlaI/MecI/CopY family transcriptional regulator n=1 Tax=Streptomyces triculaminicus TaxID=2816232 RepID=UPI0033E319D8